MLDLKQIIRFLTKNKVKISIEEFLFLNVIRIASVEDAKPESETLELIKLYYEQNTFYGRDLYNKDEAKVVGWNLLIEKLTKQGFLTDYRKDKKQFNLSELEVTETFKSLIWKDDKMEVWNDFHSFIMEKVGPILMVGDFSVSYFNISSADKYTSIKSGTDMIDYFWKNICRNGDLFAIERFFHHIEFWIDRNGLNEKIVNFLLNYHDGTRRKEIEYAIEHE